MTILQKLFPLFILLAIIGFGSGGYFYYQFQKTDKELQLINTDPSILRKAAQTEVKNLLDEVGKLINLPEGDEPIIATITDIVKLKDQAFFDHAKNGDKLIIYTQAKRVILYDPISRKIIDVGPISIGTISAQQAVKIVLRNGTDSQGLTNRIEGDVTDSLPNSQIVSKENASNQDYETSLVIALNDDAKDEAEKLANDLGISSGELPEGENKPDKVDIVVILGKDKI